MINPYSRHALAFLKDIWYGWNLNKKFQIKLFYKEGFYTRLVIGISFYTALIRPYVRSYEMLITAQDKNSL